MTKPNRREVLPSGIKGFIPSSRERKARRIGGGKKGKASMGTGGIFLNKNKPLQGASQMVRVGGAEEVVGRPWANKSGRGKKGE